MRFVCGILLLILAMSGGGVANADRERVYQNPWQPFEAIGVNDCGGEQYSFTGETLSRATVRNDASGASTCRPCFESAAPESECRAVPSM